MTGFMDTTDNSFLSTLMNECLIRQKPLYRMLDLEEMGLQDPQNNQIKEHFNKSPAYLDFYSDKMYFRKQMIITYSLFAYFCKQCLCID